MKVVSVVGARPQFVKLAPIARAFAALGIEHLIIHTGQHYDKSMSEVFFSELLIPAPDISLGVGSGSHAIQTSAMLSAIEDPLIQASPDWVLVYGDTNSTLAAALAAVKLQLPVAHLEAGLRSFNRRMPEEHNRILTDHAADLLLAPTESALSHLRNEGLGARSIVVGDVMVDVCLSVARDVAERDVSQIHPGLVPNGYFVATLHRAENTDDPERLRRLVFALQSLEIPVVLPVHPRLRDRARDMNIDLGQGAVLPIDPLPYATMVLLMSKSHGVITDSGGLQKEAYILGIPCSTLRAETEWTETLVNDWNVLVGDVDRLSEVVTRGRPSRVRPEFYGNGQAAHTVARTLVAERR